MTHAHTAHSRTSSTSANGLTIPKAHRATSLVAPLLFGRSFRAGTGYARRGAELSIKTSRVDARHTTLTIEIYPEKDVDISLSDVRFKVAVGSKELNATTNKHGHALVPNIHPEDQVTITLA